ncbi:pollen-specific leucine-rich repeat extensin-like protein 1 isoform X2 [Esox lucius]|uniref:pollen-specific leucine-rich repeat extensin-like protein 1 isoform X2 n=1 Tax=Esox lucius TaxID=8010 RepID=UPI001477097C|nr:pollen-specific leucine-rich repeat extensin-like protein 1 isoform X2 [Esox lucius]
MLANYDQWRHAMHNAPSDLEEPPALLASSSFTPLEEGKKPSGKDMQPERRAQSSILDNEMELFFKEHCPSRALPIKTSSPIHSAQQDGDRTISPLLSEDEDQNPVQQPFSTLKRQAAECTNVESEEPSQRNLSLAVEPKEPISAKIVFQTSEKMTIVQQPATKAAAFQPPETAKENQEGKVTSSFLQRLRKAGQSKPTGKVLMPFPVREAPAIELDDDFLILEDEAPSRFRFRRKPDPNKTTARPQPKQEDQSQGKENTKNQKKSDTAGEELVSMEEDQRKVEEEAADSHQEEALLDSQESEKRKRCKPGPWWRTSVVNTPDTETDNTHTSNNPTTKPTRLSSVKARLKERLSKSSSIQTAEKEAKRRCRAQRLTIEEEPERPGIPSPLRLLPHTASEVFDLIYTCASQSKKAQSSDINHYTPDRIVRKLLCPDAPHRPSRRNAPGTWWNIAVCSENIGWRSPVLLPQHLSSLPSPLSLLHSPLSLLHSPLSLLHSPLSLLHSPLSLLHSPLSLLHSPLSSLHSPLSSLHSPLPLLHSPLSSLLSPLSLPPSPLTPPAP